MTGPREVGGPRFYFGGSRGRPYGCDIRETTPDGGRDVSLIDLETVSTRCDYGGTSNGLPM